MITKTYYIPLAVLALSACNSGHTADQKYRDHVVKLACGETSYTLTSSCVKSEDPFELNECKPQALLIDSAGAKRRTKLPELPKSESKRIQASGGDVKSLFVVAWACSQADQGPIATFKYSIGGGSAEYAETWTHYDKVGKLIESQEKLSPRQVQSVERNFKKIPSIMPD